MANYIQTGHGVPLEMPYGVGVSLGMVPTQSTVRIFGHNSSIASGVTAEIWDGGGSFPYQTTAQNLEVLCASANDTAAGTGARTVLIDGLDGNYNAISETLSLNGGTAGPTVNQYLRINAFTVTSTGSGLTNAGNLTLRVAGAGATQAFAMAGYGLSRSAIFTPPAGFTLALASRVFSIPKPTAATPDTGTFAFQYRVFTPMGLIKRVPFEVQVTSSGSDIHNFPYAILVPEKNDLSVIATAGSSTIAATAVVQGMLIKNSALL